MMIFNTSGKGYQKPRTLVTYQLHTNKRD